MERREFLKVCTVGAAAAGGLASSALAADARPRLYQRALLVDGKDLSLIHI